MFSTSTLLTVVGIDVGGTRKGFHAVALENGRFLDHKKTGDARELVAWCAQGIGARVIAVDAPCRWSTDGRARPAERELMRKGVYCFSSTTRAKALVHRTDNFGWMLRGEELYQSLEATHPLCSVLPCPSERYSFETFPHAVTWHLRGGNASAKRKRFEPPNFCAQRESSFQIAPELTLSMRRSARSRRTLSPQVRNLCVLGTPKLDTLSSQRVKPLEFLLSRVPKRKESDHFPRSQIILGTRGERHRRMGLRRLPLLNDVVIDGAGHAERIRAVSASLDGILRLGSTHDLPVRNILEYA